MSTNDFTDLNSVELRKYIDEKNESQYTLIDVRQPDEYNEAHVPGAILIPLPDLIKKGAELPKEGELVFMCRSGARSKAAAVFAGEKVQMNRKIYNLSGGILEWYGKTLSGQPKVQLFGEINDLNAVIMSAVNLEKGAFNCYRYIKELFEGEAFYNAIDYLSKAEIEHAKALYNILVKRNVRPDYKKLPEFEELFESMDGEILEGGITLDAALKFIESIEENRTAQILDMCLEIEYSAFDLYKNAAKFTRDPDIEKILGGIADGEKNHMKRLSEAFSQI